MKRKLMACVTLAVLIAGFSRGDEAANAKFLKEIEGTYVAETLKKGGEDGPKEMREALSMTFKGGKLNLNVKGKDENKSAAIVIDASMKPIAIDITPNDGDNAGKPMLGIVAFEKGELKIALSDSPGGARPKDFTSTKDNKTFLLILKKQ
jgi:uncharacterized protein (TIGR03067 family)